MIGDGERSTWGSAVGCDPDDWSYNRLGRIVWSSRVQFWCDAHIETPIDVFVTEPFAFDQEYQNALTKPLYGATPVRFVSLQTLIRMKEAAGRRQDIDDVAHLKARCENDGA